MAALAGAWAREVAADAWPGPVNEGAPSATRLFVAGGATHAGKDDGVPRYTTNSGWRSTALPI